MPAGREAGIGTSSSVIQALVTACITEDILLVYL